MTNKHNYTFFSFIAIVFLWMGSLSAQELPVEKSDSIRFEILMNAKMLEEAHIDAPFIESIELTNSRLVMLSSTNQFYLLGWGGIAPVSQKGLDLISSFAYAPDGLLMIVRDREICYIDSAGKFAKLFSLPNQEMKIASGKHAIYVYDHNENLTKHAIYSIAPEGKQKELLALPFTIKSAVELDNSLLFAANSEIFSFNLKSKKMTALVSIPKEKSIESLAVDTTANRIYFSTNNEIYALKDSRALLISDKFSGMLRYFDNGLIVFNNKKKFIVRITGLEGKIKLNPAELKNSQVEKPTTDILTNTTIIDLVKSKLSDDIIINIINRSKTNFNLDVDSLIFLSSQYVSSKVIMAMKNSLRIKAGGDKKQ
jgi:hypothetical protein